VAKIEVVDESAMKAMITDDLVKAHRRRALSPDRPVLRGTAQNPDVFFQNRETMNHFYDQCPEIVQQKMDEFAKLTGRQYKLYEYYGQKMRRK
jgi:pyruvate-ferredoxin/flavodoxin oxidoreductase